MRAFQHALAIARRTRARVIAVAVVYLPKPTIQAEVDDALDAGRRCFAVAFRTLSAEACAANISLTTSVVGGEPRWQIPALAKQYGVDLIVLGRSRTSSIMEWLTGSWHHDVARHAPCQTLLLR